MTDSPFLLALGAFVTSPGFGGLAALGAAGVAYLGIVRRIRFDRESSREQAERLQADTVRAQAQQRWWEILAWLNAGRDRINREVFLDTLAKLLDRADTEEQVLMVQAALDDYQAEKEGGV